MNLMHNSNAGNLQMGTEIGTRELNYIKAGFPLPQNRSIRFMQFKYHASGLFEYTQVG